MYADKKEIEKDNRNILNYKLHIAIVKGTVLQDLTFSN